MFKRGNQLARGNPPNKNSFKNGHPAPNTAFKKGYIPWNKRKKGIGEGFWKGKKMSKTHRKKLSISHLGNPSWNKGKHPTYVQGKNHPQWKGGKVKTGKGYIKIHFPSHPFSNKQGYILEHRLVMEKILSRYLTKNEIVHHLNGIKDDNKPENLKLVVMGKNWHPCLCPKCGFEFLLK